MCDIHSDKKLYGINGFQDVAHDIHRSCTMCRLGNSNELQQSEELRDGCYFNANPHFKYGSDYKTTHIPSNLNWIEFYYSLTSPHLPTNFPYSSHMNTEQVYFGSQTRYSQIHKFIRIHSLCLFIWENCKRTNNRDREKQRARDQDRDRDRERKSVGKANGCSLFELWISHFKLLIENLLFYA